MIEVIHDDAPACLVKYQKDATSKKHNTTWSDFTENKPQCKSEINQKLMNIQSGLCAYCEHKIHNTADYHIEHIYPQRFAPLRFKYDNLILSCNNSNTCGNAKAYHFDKEKFILPTENDCESHFTYSLDGKIIAAKNMDEQQQKRVGYTIEILKLNCNNLIRSRKDIITTVLQIINELKSDPEALKVFIDSLFSRDENSYYIKPFVNCMKQITT